MSNNFKFSLHLEPKPAKFDHISIHCGIEDNIKDLKWGMVVVEQNLEQLHIVLKVNIPVNVAIGM